MSKTHNTKDTKKSCCSVCYVSHLQECECFDTNWASGVQEAIKAEEVAPVYFINLYNSKKQLHPKIQLPYLSFDDTLWITQSFDDDIRYDVTVEVVHCTNYGYKIAKINSTDERVKEKPYMAIPLFPKNSNTKKQVEQMLN
jgi:hypothetical protein